ncbi:MAG: pilus assembly protein TadG-related protein [Pseudomonadota bacterium]
MATTLLSRLARLVREERGATAVLFTVFLTAMVGMMGAAVDMGALYAAKSQLQNAADAAALAAANTMLGIDVNNRAIAQPGTALTTARTFSAANQALGVSLQLKNPVGSDFTIGYWDDSTATFDPNRSGLGITNPDDLTGVLVKVRRDNSANTPVATFFASIVGIRRVELSAQSTAFLGFPGSVPAGTVDLPIAVLASAIGNGNGPVDGMPLTFHSNGDQSAEWTTFFTWPANNPNVDKYVTGELPIPAIKVGDEINLTNGNLSNGTFHDLQSRFEANAVNGQWQVTLPVIGHVGCGANQSEVVGFTTFVITEVLAAPQKLVNGFIRTQTVVTDSTTGGGNYGARAAVAKLVR